ncbi:PASTA domain-containing protein [Nocardia spumae]|uniref:PASTA domain-containing protein n=1 Tax=Nocardia spumae TaxID=2887190 RepID=UPI001D15B1DA|nr:PASTA domain-containing protein [Nocardia spumae]
MRRTVFAATLIAAALAVGACGGSTDDHGSPAPSTSAVAQAGGAASNGPAAGQDCAAQPWPRPLPDFRGKRLGETVVGAGLCFAITSITAADGHDVMNDPTAATTPWTVSGQQPAAGTSVAADTPVTLTVEAPH